PTQAPRAPSLPPNRPQRPVGPVMVEITERRNMSDVGAILHRCRLTVGVRVSKHGVDKPRASAVGPIAGIVARDLSISLLQFGAQIFDALLSQYPPVGDKVIIL